MRVGHPCWGENADRSHGAIDPLARKSGLAKMGFDGGVIVRIWGDDVDAVVEDERERWDRLVEDGTARSWEWSEDGDALVEHLGERGAERYLQFVGLSTRLSRLVHEELETSPDPVDDYPDERRAAPAGVGWWRLLHLLTIQQNYRYGEELDAHVEGIRSVVHTIAQFDDRGRAIREVDAVVESLEALRAEIQG